VDLGALVQIFFAGLMLVTGFVVGEILERRHYKSIRARELRWRRMPAITLGYIPVPEGWDYEKAGLVTGHVVISVDHFKRFVAGLRQIFGGRIRAYETLMDRARREAVLRLKQHAIDEGYHAVVNMRLESVRLASARRKGKGTAGIEVLAFGTGIRMARTGAA
jgi:uncharacterized protein YbjQ (UPF0145 family)